MTDKPQRQNWTSFGHILGRKLRDARVMRGWTQQELAEATGLNRNTVSNLERNLGTHETPADPGISTLYLLARALEVPPAVLLPEGGEVPGPRCMDDAVLEIDVRWPTDEFDRLSFQERAAIANHDAPRRVRGAGARREISDAASKRRDTAGRRDAAEQSGAAGRPGPAGAHGGAAGRREAQE